MHLKFNRFKTEFLVFPLKPFLLKVSPSQEMATLYCQFLRLGNLKSAWMLSFCHTLLIMYQHILWTQFFIINL